MNNDAVKAQSCAVEVQGFDKIQGKIYDKA
jgi:hypothetical protein